MAEIYVPGPFDFVGTANALSQLQSGRIAQENARLQQQYTMEDRARAAQERSAAAGNARAELARKQQFMDTIKGGYMPAKTAVMGPGTVQGNTPASFDPEKVKNELFRRGDLSGLVTFSNAQEQFAKQTEQEAKAAGQSLTNEGIRATNTGTNFKNTADFIKMTNAQIDAAPDIASLRAIVAATFTPDHPMAKFNELNGLTLEQSMAAIDGLIAQGKTFEQIREQMSQGASKAAENIAARGLVAAQTNKAVAETAQVGKPAPVTPTNLAKLLTEQAALPPDSPARQQYDAAIAKELAVSDAAQSPLGKLVTERNRLNQNDPLRAQYDAAILKEASGGALSQSPIGKLVAERDKLPPGDPLRAQYDAMIAKETGSAGAVIKAEDAVVAAEDLVGKIEALLKHPGKSEAVGISFGSGMIPGTDARGFIARHNEILGSAFLDAYNILRGTGSITEIEGVKATAAKNRMDLSTSEEEYTAAAEEYMGYIKRGIEREKARMQKLTGGADATSATAKTETPPDIQSILNKYK